MTAYEQAAMLESMVILADTREQQTAKTKRRYESMGVPVKRVTLSYGDYSYNATLPGGSRMYDEEKTIKPQFYVERKMDLDEWAGCFTRGRERFRREFERARENGANGIVIVENATWENLINGRYRSRFNSKAFLASATAWMLRYDLHLLFCKEETSGQLIKELCYRDLKERIDRGEFDEE
ncbi:MAG: hypothetical protein IJP92_02675 [Lachnospiraceae bacterium]|nr:hypothetical protein [Lachnospiraceae bacterium]